MKNSVKYLLCAFVLLLFCQQNYAKGRTVHSINDSWQFRFSETCEGNEGWTIVSVPHSWNDKDCLDDVSRYNRGKGWYRRNLYVDKEMASQPLYIPKFLSTDRKPANTSAVIRSSVSTSQSS